MQLKLSEYEELLAELVTCFAPFNYLPSFVVLSPSNSPQRVQKYYKIGFVDVLSKPLQSAEVRSLLSKLLLTESACE